jgi:hypothetical protein
MNVLKAAQLFMSSQQFLDEFKNVKDMMQESGLNFKGQGQT